MQLLGEMSAQEAQRRLVAAEAQAKQLAGGKSRSDTANRIDALNQLVSRITVHPELLKIAVSFSAIGTDQKPMITDQEVTIIEVPVALKRCGKAVRLIVYAPGELAPRAPDAKLLGLLAKAHEWFGNLISVDYDSVCAIAEEEELTRGYVTKVIHLAFLAPDILDRCVKGTQPPELNARRLVRMGPLPLDWAAQREQLGLSH